jgi:hypothetical protein
MRNTAVTVVACAAVLVATVACVQRRQLPMLEAQSAADVAFDSMPVRTERCPPAMVGDGEGVPPGFRIGYHAISDSSGIFLEFAFIIHASESWFAQPRRPRSEAVRQRLLSLGCVQWGSNAAGPMVEFHATRTGLVWLDTVEVRLGFDNVLLLDVDSAGRERVIGRAHVRPRLTPPIRDFSGDKRAMSQHADDHVWSVLMTSETVRRFVSGKYRRPAPF